MSTSNSTFNESLFEKKLLQLRETHESISNLSTWCLANQAHHTKIVSLWLSVLKRVKIEHRLLLFYLANDIIQYSRRKHLPFVEAFAPVLQKATTMVREDNVKNKVMRLFKIWDDRGIYDEAFLLDLSGLLICDPKGGSRMDIQDFQPNIMYSRIRSCKKLEDDTDNKLRILNESEIPITNVERLRKTLKDREHSEDVMEDVEQALTKIKSYIDALEAEIKERSGLLDMLDTSEQYYEKDLKEAKIVVNAYKCFGQRVKQVQKKLEEKMPMLPSPVPSPDINAPSPSPPMSPDEELNLSNFNPGNFTMGESFINNSSVIEKALDSQNNSFYNDRPNYYSPAAVYTPSMTTGAQKNNISYTPTLNSSQYNSADTSYNSQYGSNENIYNSNYDSEYNNSRNYNSDSQLSNEDNYPAEYFIGANPNEDGRYLEPRENKRMESSVFSSLMDSHGGLLPPPPPPPLPNKLPPQPKNNENKIEVIGGKHLSLPSPFTLLQSIVKKDITLPSTPVIPPPTTPAVIPSEPITDEEAWNENDWNSPLSPPPYEDFPTIDTDMRKKDVDHRNLISLTGWDSKTGDENSKDKDERPVRPRIGSGLYHDSDSSDSRSPPDHIPRLNLPPLDVPPPVINQPPTNNDRNIVVSPLNDGPVINRHSGGISSNILPVNLPSNLSAPKLLPPPNLPVSLISPPNFEEPPPQFDGSLPRHFQDGPPPLFQDGPPPHFQENRPPPHFQENRPPQVLDGPPPHFQDGSSGFPGMLPHFSEAPPHFNTGPSSFEEMQPYDNVENIDMEMSDEERETSPANKRPALVPLTPNDDEEGSINFEAPVPTKVTKSIIPPPAPDMPLIKPFSIPHGQRMPRLNSPMLETRPPRLPRMGPPTPERGFLPPPGISPRPPHRPQIMIHSPRPPFFQQGGHRPFRPRHFRPRFQPRW